MNVRIDYDCCTSCAACVEHCPGEVLAMDDEERPFERYPDDCWYCGVCAVECPVGCITVVFPYLVR
jgi:adenylylsulfate reductase subunit B